MTCRELIEVLDEYLEGRMAPGPRGVFEAHLAECPYCVDYLESYRETLRRVGRAFDDPDAELPGDVPEELVAAVLAARAAGR